MYFIIYKTTNLINGKFYIGKHQTTNLYDEYVGSGKLLKRAIKKYGKENFYKEILEVYDTESKMNLAEKILVVIDREISYNLCDGGHGGFGYINRLGINNTNNHTIEHRKKSSELLKKQWEDDEYKINHVLKTKKLHRLGKMKRGYFGQRGEKDLEIFQLTHSVAAKEKRRNTYKTRSIGQGNKNSQFGTCWITNGVENKKIKKDDLDNWIVKGYSKGRIKII